MKKHMKKVLALLLCALMIIPAALPAFAEGTEPEATAKAGPLAITEVVERAPTEGYSYVEILNTSNQDVDLSNYYLYRAVANLEGKNPEYATHIEQMLSLNGKTPDHVAAVKLASTQTLIKAGEVKVLWLKTKDMTKDFVTYWRETSGSVMVASDVITVDVSTLKMDNAGGTGGGAYFLPRNTWQECAIALVKKSDSGLEANTYEAKNVSTATQFAKADSIALLNHMTLKEKPDNLTAQAAHFNAYIEKDSFNSAVNATSYHSSIDSASKITKYYYDDLYPSIVVSNPSSACRAYYNLNNNTNNQWPWQSGGSHAIPMPEVTYSTSFTPGRLNGVQYGHQEQGGPLAITEVSHNPSNGTNFEYIEVINTVEGTTVDLANYHVYRFMFSHAGKSAYSGFGQIMGTTGNNCYATTKVDISANKQIPYNTPVLVWFNLGGANTVADFVEHWNGKITNDADKITADDVVEVEVNANYNVNKYKSYVGAGFLPDSECGFVLSLINDSYANADTVLSISSTTGLDSSEGYRYTQSRHRAADAMTMVYALANLPDTVANRYGYMDVEAFNTAVANAEFNNPATATLPAEFKYASLMMPKPSSTGSVALTRLENTYHEFRNMEATNSVYMLDVTAWETPTPAKLNADQAPNGKYNNVTATSVTTKGLAITEIMPVALVDGTGNYGNADWEFIEVTNTYDTAVTLTNYHLVLHGGTNNGGNDGIFANRPFHQAQPANQKSYAEIKTVWTIGTDGNNLTATTVSTSLNKNNTAVIWFKNSAIAADVVNFAKFWAGRGNDMVGVTVAVADYAVGSSLTTRGNGFLPDAKVGYGLALVDTSKATDGSTLKNALANSKSLTTAGTVGYGKAIEAAADSVLWIIGEDGIEKNVSCNYYSYIDENKYTEDVRYYAQGILAYNTEDSNGNITAYGTATTYKENYNGIKAAYNYTNVKAVAMKGQPLYTYVQTDTNAYRSESIKPLGTGSATNLPVYKDTANKSEKLYKYNDKYYLVSSPATEYVPAEGTTPNYVRLQNHKEYSAYNNDCYITMSDNNCVGLATVLNSVPTPGKLLHGQFGYDAHSESATIDVFGYQTGTISTDLRIVGELNVAQSALAGYRYVGIEIAGASAATNAHLINAVDNTVDGKGIIADDRTNKDANASTISNAFCTKQVEITSETVYKTLTDANGATYANENGYMFALNISGVPATNCNFTFRCFVEDNAGNRIYTGVYQISDMSYNALAY